MLFYVLAAALVLGAGMSQMWPSRRIAVLTLLALGFTAAAFAVLGVGAAPLTRRPSGWRARDPPARPYDGPRPWLAPNETIAARAGALLAVMTADEKFAQK